MCPMVLEYNARLTHGPEWLVGSRSLTSDKSDTTRCGCSSSIATLSFKVSVRLSMAVCFIFQFVNPTHTHLKNLTVTVKLNIAENGDKPC